MTNLYRNIGNPSVDETERERRSRRLPDQGEFKDLIERTGFDNVSYRNPRCSITCIRIGQKPAATVCRPMEGRV